MKLLINPFAEKDIENAIDYYDETHIVKIFNTHEHD